MDLIGGHTGEIAALSAALCWALSTVMYRPIGYRLSPAMMNLYKGLIASGLLVVMIVVGWVVHGSGVGAAPARAWVLLALSGVIGIGAGDTFFFACLRQLGARRAMLMVTLGPPLTALVGLYYPGEAIGGKAWLGIGLTMAGIVWVICERSEMKGPGSAEHHTGRGIFWGVAFSLCAAVAALVSRDVMDHTDVAADVAALVRVVSGVVFVCLILPVLRRYESRAVTERPAMTLRGWGLFCLAVFFGTFLGIWLFQVSVEYTKAGIAMTLVTTSTLFVLPIALVLGERVSLRATIGAVIAVGGIVLLFSDG